MRRLSTLKAIMETKTKVYVLISGCLLLIFGRKSANSLYLFWILAKTLQLKRVHFSRRIKEKLLCSWERLKFFGSILFSFQNIFLQKVFFSNSIVVFPSVPENFTSQIFLIYSKCNVSKYWIRKSKLFPVCRCCYAENGKVFPFFANIFFSLFVLHFKFSWKRL